jgi:hypothetical protein
MLPLFPSVMIIAPSWQPTVSSTLSHLVLTDSCLSLLRPVKMVSATEIIADIATKGEGEYKIPWKTYKEVEDLLSTKRAKSAYFFLCQVILSNIYTAGTLIIVLQAYSVF